MVDDADETMTLLRWETASNTKKLPALYDGLAKKITESGALLWNLGRAGDGQCGQ